jgi:hypothetical protein
MSRDDILAYWGVPKSQIGMDVPSGLNSGSTKDRDTAVLWQGAVHSRLVPFAEVLQFQLLDRWMKRGVRIELEIEEPDFTEDAPKFQNAATALSQPLRNRERRAILGLDPLGDPALDEAVWMPVTMTNMFTAPDPEGRPVETEDEEEPTTIEVKARTRPRNRAAGMQRSLTKLRTNLDRSATPRIRSAVADVLDEQRDEIIRKVRENAAHIIAHPDDTDAWWNGKKWDAKMRRAITPNIAGVAESVTEHIGEVLSP